MDTINNFEVYSDVASGGTYSTLVGSSATSPLGGITESLLYFKVRAQTTDTTWSLLSSVYGTLGTPDAPTNISYTTSGNLWIFTWTNDPDAENVTVVQGTQSFPTSITDGTVVYTGTGTTFTENAVNDEVYLSFFSDNMAGDSDTPAPFTAGGNMSIFLGLIGLAGILSFLAFKFPNYLLAIVSGASWIVLIPYLAANPFGGITTGSNTQQILFLVFGGAGLAMLITTIMRAVSKQKELRAQVEFYKTGGSDKPDADSYSAYMTAKRTDSDEDESIEEYRKRIHEAHARGIARARTKIDRGH
jgi:hypothetical protein